MDFEDPEEEERVNALFQYLVEEGALVLASIDEEGEPLYKITQKCKEILPELYEAHRSDVNRIANGLWQLGMVEISFGESNDDVNVRMSPLNYEKFLSNKHLLSKEQRDFVYTLMGGEPDWLEV